MARRFGWLWAALLLAACVGYQWLVHSAVMGEQTDSIRLALTLLPHALERFAIEAGCTVHIEAAGEDDHHVAEAAFKALGRALREACSRDGVAPPVGSTKGAL